MGSFIICAAVQCICMYIQNTMDKTLVNKTRCDIWSLFLEFPVGESYVTTRGESTFWCPASCDGFVVVVWFTDFMNCDSALPENKLTASWQACMPSTHVCSVLELPLAPQLLNQAPPGAQQLSLPDFLMITHLGHTGAILVVAGTASIDTQTLIQYAQATTSTQRKTYNFTFCMPWSYLFRRPASLRATCAQHHRCVHSDQTKHH